MKEDIQRGILAEMRQAHEIAAVAGRSARATRSDLVCWKRQGRIFSIQDGCAEYFPIFALDSVTVYQPYPAFAEALRILNASKWGSDWAVAAGFIGLRSFLDDQRPENLLASDPGWVVEAAKDAVCSLIQRP